MEYFRFSSKKLIFRLSSAGDILLALSICEHKIGHRSSEIWHWVVKKEFADIIALDPRIDRVIVWDPSSGLLGWVRLVRALAQGGPHGRYDEVIDLHSNLRTWIARILFLPTSIPWRRIRKNRLSLIGFFVFKKKWPKKWLPKPWWVRFQEMGLEPTQAFKPVVHQIVSKTAMGTQQIPLTQKYICVAPSSRWQQKEWPIQSMIQLCQQVHQKTGHVLLVLGSEKDPSSKALSVGLKKLGIPHEDGVGRYNFQSLCSVIQQAELVISVDSAIYHLAESLGKKVLVIFGPTSPLQGFGPRLRSTRVITKQLWCQPCGKDGRTCIRILDRYACLTQIKVEDVLSAVLPML